MKKIDLQIHEKFMITVTEASAYFNIGIKRLERWRKNTEVNLLFREATGS